MMQKMIAAGALAGAMTLGLTALPSTADALTVRVGPHGGVAVRAGGFGYAPGWRGYGYRGYGWRGYGYRVGYRPWGYGYGYGWGGGRRWCYWHPRACGF